MEKEQPAPDSEQRIIRQAFAAACREGQPEAIALAVAMRAVLDRDPVLSVETAYDRVTRVIAEETAASIPHEETYSPRRHGGTRRE